MLKLRVIVTGASGFVGRFVVHALAAKPDVQIVPVSRREISRGYRVANYSESPHGDVLLHLAEDNDRGRVAQAGVAYEEETRSTLLALMKKNYDRVVYVSSAALYGDRDIHPHGVDDPVHVNDIYTRVKRQSELIVLESSIGVVVRLSNVYGPGMANRNVISTIIRQIPGSGPLHVQDKDPVRDFLWVEDAAEGVTALACLADSQCGGVFNLGTGIGTSIGTLARMAVDIAEQPDREIIGGRSARPSHLIVDYSRTASLCGWEPRTSLDNGLSRLLDKGRIEKYEPAHYRDFHR